MYDTINRIEQAGRREIGILVDAAMKRYRELFPDWEILYYAYPRRDAEEEKSTWERMLEDLNDG